MLEAMIFVIMVALVLYVITAVVGLVLVLWIIKQMLPAYRHIRGQSEKVYSSKKWEEA